MTQAWFQPGDEATVKLDMQRVNRRTGVRLVLGAGCKVLIVARAGDYAGVPVYRARSPDNQEFEIDQTQLRPPPVTGPEPPPEQLKLWQDTGGEG